MCIVFRNLHLILETRVFFFKRERIILDRRVSGDPCFFSLTSRRSVRRRIAVASEIYVARDREYRRIVLRPGQLPYFTACTRPHRRNVIFRQNFVAYANSRLRNSPVSFCRPRRSWEEEEEKQIALV